MRTMINTDPSSSRSFQFRFVALFVAVVAALAAVSGAVGSGTVLAWAVAVIALSVFGASFYLKS